MILHAQYAHIYIERETRAGALCAHAALLHDMLCCVYVIEFITQIMSYMTRHYAWSHPQPGCAPDGMGP